MAMVEITVSIDERNLEFLKVADQDEARRRGKEGESCVLWEQEPGIWRLCLEADYIPHPQGWGTTFDLSEVVSKVLNENG